MASPQAKRGEAQLQLLDPPTGGGTQPGGNIGTAITFQFNPNQLSLTRMSELEVEKVPVPGVTLYVMVLNARPSSSCDITSAEVRPAPVNLESVGMPPLPTSSASGMPLVLLSLREIPLSSSNP